MTLYLTFLSWGLCVLRVAEVWTWDEDDEGGWTDEDDLKESWEVDSVTSTVTSKRELIMRNKNFHLL